MNTTTFGPDVAKRTFQMYWVEAETGEIVNRRFTKQQLIEFLGQHATARVVLEACGSAHHRARELQKLGHDVKFISVRSVRPFVLRNKPDAADARAIWTAIQQPDARMVAIKSESQQAIPALHRMRAQPMKFRIMQTNALRRLLYEFGEVLPEGYREFAERTSGALAKIAERLPAILIDSLREQWARAQSTEKEIAALERRLKVSLREHQECQKIAEIPGVGMLTATAAVAAVGDAKVFRSGHEFAAWLGLVPKQTGTGGHVRQLSLSKRGDTYLRTLIIHGARSVIIKGSRTAWLDGVLQRRPFNVVV